MFAPIFPKRLWKARIRWTKPSDYDQVLKTRNSADKKAHFYSILSRGKSGLLLHYVGKTYRSEVWLRLRQVDHTRRLEQLKRKFRRRTWLLSHGILNLGRWKRENGRYPSSKRISDIECLLICANHAQTCGINQRSHRAYQITDHYCVINTGHFQPLKPKIFLTLFEQRSPKPKNLRNI